LRHQGTLGVEGFALARSRGFGHDAAGSPLLIALGLGGIKPQLIRVVLARSRLADFAIGKKER
jgi:hypothetical protein